MTLVVVGTGTDVGKTVLSAVVLARHGAAAPLAYWKPIASGARDGRDMTTVAALLADPSSSGADVQFLPERYIFDEPLSPHLAARLAGQCIDPATVLADYDRHRAGGRGLLVETAGGLLVPLLDDGAYLQADLLVAMAGRTVPSDLGCLVVGHSGLGTINHTLLTLEALRARGLAIAAVVLNGPRNDENRRAIASYGGIDSLLDLPPIEPLTPATLAAAAFDPDACLAPWLRAMQTLRATPSKSATLP
jgi:dethiobiotin synthase